MTLRNDNRRFHIWRATIMLKYLAGRRAHCPSLVISTLPLLLIVMLTQPTDADEGMWLFNNPPSKLLKRKYDFEPSTEWLAHLQRAAVRFNDGGSGSFISADGLVL